MRTEKFSQFAMLIGVVLTFATGAFAATSQQSFASPEDAVSTLVGTIKSNDVKAMRSVLGNAGGVLSSGDAVADRAATQDFVAAYDAKHSIVLEGDTAKLILGKDDFPFAFPLVKSGGVWRFDTAAGIDELNARRIGENELNTINVLQAIVDAQQEYASEPRTGDGVAAYARRIISSKGKRDGLYWPTKAGEPPSPLGELVASASGEGYAASKSGPKPFHGYYFRTLKGQAAGANGAALDYVVRGHAIGGFAVIAYPAKYGSSGIMSFVVNQDGKVYQSDLGPKTLERATAIHRFDTAKGWSPVSP
ncbi:MAG: DUF2950 domain-containing protein [Betaproteobacteria bacterium]